VDVQCWFTVCSRMVIFMHRACNRFDAAYTIYTDDQEALEWLQAACVYGRHEENSSRPRSAAVCVAVCADLSLQ